MRLSRCDTARLVFAYWFHHIQPWDRLINNATPEWYLSSNIFFSAHQELTNFSLYLLHVIKIPHENFCNALNHLQVWRSHPGIRRGISHLQLHKLPGKLWNSALHAHSGMNFIAAVDAVPSLQRGAHTTKGTEMNYTVRECASSALRNASALFFFLYFCKKEKNWSRPSRRRLAMRLLFPSHTFSCPIWYKGLFIQID